MCCKGAESRNGNDLRCQQQREEGKLYRSGYGETGFTAGYFSVAGRYDHNSRTTADDKTQRRVKVRVERKQSVCRQNADQGQRLLHHQRREEGRHQYCRNTPERAELQGENNGGKIKEAEGIAKYLLLPFTFYLLSAALPEQEPRQQTNPCIRFLASCTSCSKPLCQG